ncbi:MAG: 50S ribosomal protein L3 N(5)-glutamine methyltransferase, partial [Ilumatobacteraceae bacterium]
MRKVSHKPKALTVSQALRRAARRLERAGVFFGHGTDNAIDEAAALLWHVLGIEGPISERIWARNLRAREQMAFEALLELRISTRQPAVY